jgi:CzcA family heavy metal efflux pump
MRWIVGWSLRFRYLVAGLAAGLMFFGVQLLGHEKLDVFPEFAPVSVEIQTACLGLSPQDVESLTTIPLEAALQGVPGVADVQSYSEPQLSAIYLYFRSGTSLLHARQLVQERLQTTAPTLPTWCDPPQMYPIVSATSRVMQIGFTSRTVSPLDLSTIAQWVIRPKLMAVPGVANAAIWGANPRQIMVEGDPALMRARGVTLDQMMSTAADAVDAAEVRYTTGSAVGSLGFVQTPAQQLDVAGIQPIHTPAQVAQVPLETGDGKLITIGQVARVVWGYPTPTGNAVVGGGPGLMMVVEKFPGANTLQVTRGVDQALAELAPGLRGIRVDPDIFRQASFIETAIHNLGLSVILGCILVVFVLLAFLFQWRAALISLLAIPLSLVTAAIVLELAGSTINTMVLAGFAVAVGVVVDDAIIDMENIVRRLRARRAQGRRITPLHLVLAASLEVRVAIFYATLINIVAVVPVMLVGGLTGAFFEPLALAYGLAVLASMLVALTVTPALGLILLGGARLAPADPPLMRALKRGYTGALRPALRSPWWALVVVPVAVAAAVVVYPRIGQDLFPDFKEPDFLVHFVTKPDTSLPDMDRDVTRLQHELLAIPGVAAVGSHIGTAPLGEEINGVNFSESWLSLSPDADYPKVLAQVRAVAAAHPGSYSDVQTYLHERIDEVLTDGTTDDIVVRVYGPGLSELGAVGNRLAAVLARIPGLVDVHPVALEFIPQVDVQVNLAAAQRYGLTPGVVRRAAAIMMASEPMSEISSGGVLTVVAAWSTPATRQNLASLRQLPIDTPSGGHVALGQVASITVQPSPSQVLRENGQRYTEVDADVSGRSLGSVTGAVRSAIAAFRFPSGYRYALLGEATERAGAQRRLLIDGLAAAVVILLLLQVASGSWRLSFLLFLTLPTALVGGVLAAWGALGTITLGALVGFFTVLGIAARNGILLISHFRHLEQAEGEPFGPRLVLRGASERLSPILMTALATALALVPLIVYGNRPGQEIEYPMAIVILGGLATSTLLNLFVLPVLYLWIGQSRRDRRRRKAQSGTPAAAP